MVVKRIVLAVVIAGVLVGGYFSAKKLVDIFLGPSLRELADLRKRAEGFDRELADALANYQHSSGELGSRIRDLETALQRERRMGELAVERTRRAEERAGELAGQLAELAEAGGRIEGVAGAIRSEAQAGLEDLEALGRLLGSGP